MSIFSRTRHIIAANVTDLLDRAEDPAKMLRMIILEMEETLVEVRASAARTIADQKEMRRHLASLNTDVTSLSEHASFLSDNLTFLLDASLGLISIEQNAAMKLFSWAAVVFLPPTLIAGIFGMNFHHMPELDWSFGYPLSLALIVASGVLPYFYFRYRRWI